MQNVVRALHEAAVLLTAARPLTVDAFGKRLRRYLASNHSYEVAGPDFPGTWMAGGCYLLAHALKAVLGPDAEIVGVGTDVAPLDHVVVKYAGRYLDADGASSLPELLHKMETVEHRPNPRLVPVRGVPADFYFEKAISAALQDAIIAKVGRIGGGGAS